MSKDRPAILLTGFGPFPTVAANATSVLVPMIAEAAREIFPDVKIVDAVLPTEWHGGLHAAEQLYHRHNPAVALHFGVSGRASGFEIETRGRNRCSMSMDAAGFLPMGHELAPDGPEFLVSPLPASHIVQRLRRRGIPAMISRDAGGYLCNALLYHVLSQRGHRVASARSGFIHLPANLVHERTPWRGPLRSCRLSWDDVVAGGVEIIATCLRRTSPTAPPQPKRRLAM
ncbi:MAG: pyroglutamyl-peptidase I [Hyphomicrobiaceae bacterium]